MSNTIRSWLSPFLKYNWIFGLVLVLLFTAMRFYLVLNANLTKNYGSTGIIFLVMIALPFLILNRAGRQQIGITKPKNYGWLIGAFFVGVGICTVIYFLFSFLYDHSISNSMVYISTSYAVSDLNADNKLTYFIIYALTGMTFSSFGEELFYRGLVHGSFAPKFGEQKASVIDSIAFAIAHLSHFGIIYYAGKWDLLIIPAILWVASMFFSSRLFFYCKQKTGSILGAILAHAGFNFAMMYWIFYHIL